MEKEKFGSVPKGALLFIVEPVGPKTPAKFRDDRVGDATHMGIVTGRNEGAIHSSKSRGGVVTSKFAGKTIPNGGWNRVGLLPVFDYGVRRSLDSLRALGYRKESHALWAAARSPLRKSHWLFLRALRTRGR